MRTKNKLKAGDKVVRVDIGCEVDLYKRIAYGKTYTIRKIDICEYCNIIYLAGFPNKVAMWAKRFVKVRK